MTYNNFFSSMNSLHMIWEALMGTEQDAQINQVEP